MAENHSRPDLRCAHCDDRIGVYEPLWYREADGRLVAGTYLALADRLPHDAQVLHAGCVSARPAGGAA